MASSLRSEESSADREIHLRLEDDTWVAEDVETGVESQDASREVALENIDEAVALYDGEVGRQPTTNCGRWGSTPMRTELGIRPNLTPSTEQMCRRTFSGREIVKVLVNVGRFEWRRTTGDHAQLYYRPDERGRSQTRHGIVARRTETRDVAFDRGRRGRRRFRGVL